MRRYIYVLFLFCSVNITLYAQQDDTSIRRKIGQIAHTIKTMQCDFVQTKHLKMLNDNMVSKGRMYYQQSDRLRWEYISPYTYTFIINKDKVLLKNNRRNDVIDVNKNKIFKEIARIMMNSVVGNCLNDDKDFKSSISVVRGEWVAVLQPQRRELKQMFQKIVLHFSQNQAIVTRVELIEKNGDKTEIELKNIRTNETINSNIFALN
jgi:outer membrane lipoprotein carrier protein